MKYLHVPDLTQVASTMRSRGATCQLCQGEPLIVDFLVCKRLMRLLKHRSHSEKYSRIVECDWSFQHDCGLDSLELQKLGLAAFVALSKRCLRAQVTWLHWGHQTKIHCPLHRAEKVLNSMEDLSGWCFSFKRRSIIGAPHTRSLPLAHSVILVPPSLFA